MYMLYLNYITFVDIYVVNSHYATVISHKYMDIYMTIQ